MLEYGEEKIRWFLNTPAGRKSTTHSWPTSRESAYGSARNLVRNYYASNQVRQAIALIVLGEAYKNRSACVVPSFVRKVADYYIYDFS